MFRLSRRLAISAVIVGAFGVLWWGAMPWLDAARVLAALVDGTSAPGERTTVDYQVAGRPHQGDLYPATGTARVGLVVIPGAAELGKDDQRLVRFAATLAEAGFTVLVPDIASQKALQVGPENVTDVADAIDWLAGRERRVGVAAISYAVGPAVLAGLAEGQKLSFLVGVGGYFDLTAVIAFFTTGWYFEDGRWQQRQPNAYGKWVFVRSNAARLWDSGDRALLEIMAARRMADEHSDIADLALRLTPTARPIYDLLTNLDPQRVPALIDKLPPDMRDDIHALDLKTRDLSHLKAHLLLIHGKDDTIVPAGESRKLAAAVPDARLFIVDDLAHADWSPHKLGSMVDLLTAMRALLDERDRARV
jgi:pimeloyl-ACP methyl ester carboxylesterase